MAIRHGLRRASPARVDRSADSHGVKVGRRDADWQPRASVLGRYLSAMFMHECTARVRYAETDQMGFVYYGRYAELFEVGRVEAMRALGFPYRALEDAGVLLPVRSLSIEYHRPARYDDLLTIRTTITSPPEARIVFRYAVLNEQGALLCDGETTLVFVDRATMRPRRAPQDLVQALAPHFA